MLGIGLRQKILVSIFFVLLLTVASVSLLLFYFFKSERVRLIDQQIQSIASGLVVSRFSEEELDKVGDVIADRLNDEPSTVLILIYDKEGRQRFKNENAEMLLDGSFVDSLQERFTIQTRGHRVRFLNLQLDRRGNRLLVGLLLDKGNLHWNSLSLWALMYVGLILVLVLLATAYLAKIYFQPLRKLSNYLHYFADNITRPENVPQMGHALGDLLKYSRKGDEFSELLQTVRDLSEKLRERFVLAQGSAAQMAHEIKTPLTVIRNFLESLGNQKGVQEALDEVDHLSLLITSFLDWARLRHLKNVPQDLHALRAVDVVEDVIRRLESIYPHRIRLTCRKSFTFFAKPEWATQALSNLVENALKYSPLDKEVEISIDENLIEIKDHGAGIPASVLARIGEPFNAGKQSGEFESRRTGLGLAWVTQVAKAYDWKLSIENCDGACIRLLF